jgi:AsmA protein
MKRVVAAAIATIAVLAIIVAVMPLLISGSFLKNLIAAQITAWTGREVTISGEPGLSLYPYLAITTDQVTVGNPQGMGDDQFIVAEGLRAKMRILPLLIGRTEFDEFELIRPRIRLVVNSDGRINWRMGRSAIVAQALLGLQRDADTGLEAGEGSGAQNPPAAPDVQIGRLKIDDGIVLYDDLASDHREEMSALNLEVSWPSAATAARGMGSVQWRGERIEFNGSLAAPLALIGGGTSPVRFAIAATALRLSFTGNASRQADARLDGQASVATPSLRRVIEWMGTPMGTGPILGAASIAGALHWAGTTASFDPAHVELDGNSAEGTLALDFGGPRPAVRASLSADTLDFTPYVDAARADLLAEGSWLIAPVRLGVAETVDADIAVSAGQAFLGVSPVGDLSASMTIRNGSLNLDIGDGSSYGGKFKAHIELARNQEALSAHVTASAADVGVLSALQDLAGMSALDGSATASLDMSGRGKTWGEFARSIGGSARVEVRDGTLAGFDVGAVADAMGGPLAEPVQPGPESTAFSDLTASLVIAEGNLATDDLLMLGDGFRLTVAGRGSVLNGLIDARARIEMAERTVPIAITGKWRAPLVSPTSDTETVPIEPVEPGKPTGG